MGKYKSTRLSVSDKQKKLLKERKHKQLKKNIHDSVDDLLNDFVKLNVKSQKQTQTDIKEIDTNKKLTPAQKYKKKLKLIRKIAPSRKKALENEKKKMMKELENQLDDAFEDAFEDVLDENLSSIFDSMEL